MKFIDNSQRSVINKILLFVYISIDIIMALLIFIVWGEKYIALVASGIGIDLSALTSGIGLLGLAVILVNGTAVVYTFPSEAKRVRTLYWEKVIVLAVLFLGVQDIVTSLFLYGITEMIGLAAGLGLSLMLYRVMIPGALTFIDTLPENPRWWHKAKIYFWNPEFLPILIFGIPLVLWGASLFYLNYLVIKILPSGIPWWLVISLWVASIVPIVFSRYRYMMEYFSLWYKNAESLFD